ncbi:UvrD-helicase domain-containing protein [Pseudomonas lactis]|uniref:UvrD-helicase domain-containing protein n=1 Tax=Pseudomonas lactis TaxID=1615674 RepID=UPI0011856156|nr:UvrD-helicase domain-containing protein [Pseudomonas lactis]
MTSLETLDVSACPDSGKTTLVVAKLAILARKWKCRTRGICVLSHTNVAREEIEHRLGGTEVGQRLLNYPHFIDTLHGFVNKFLASPWLRSAGHPITAIDDELTIRARQRAIHGWQYRGINTFLERRGKSLEKLRIASADFDKPLGKDFPSGPHTDTYKNASTALGNAAKEGYFCYDEIFVLGEALISEQPGLPAVLQQRFPCVLIDEMQDTSETQNEFLRRLFPRDNPELCVLRVGDPNQAIFEGDLQDIADGFPDVTRYVGIANSFRFDPSIARLANPFAVTPILPEGLQGIRSLAIEEKPLPHTIFVFPDHDASPVLDAYGQLVLKHLPAEVRLKSSITAIGAVHKHWDLQGLDPKHYPKTVCHYWEGYEPGAHRTSYRPSSLIEYIHIARNRVTLDATTHVAVESIASGIIHLANLLSPAAPLRARSRQHLQIESLLHDSPEIMAVYRGLLSRMLFNHKSIGQVEWTGLKPSIKRLGATLVGGTCLGNADDYLAWSDAVVLHGTVEGSIESALPNHYRCTYGGATVDIKLSSIHVAKGQTHGATLVLETFKSTHFLNKLMPWLLGKNTNGAVSKSDAETERLMAMYVAVTRPTHLLCLAMRNSSLGTGKKYQANQDVLRERGWQIQH